MKRTFVVEYVTPDKGKLKIVELDKIVISKRGNADKQLVDKVKTIIKDFGNKHEEDFPMIYNWFHDTYEFLYDVEEMGWNRKTTSSKQIVLKGCQKKMWNMQLRF